ncbi:MAG: acetolactate synthase large subunit [Microthrixaceae bacterium]
MNGAQAMIRTLTAAGVDTCFMNPGTSEMHFVAALDDVPEMSGVLALFEGVATGAADGYSRMAGKPAAVLLHLGPGLGNGLANLHNARRGHVPIVNIVGDHASYHARFDAPLQSDIAAIASSLEGWVRTVEGPEDIATATAEAVSASQSGGGQIATLITPADACWLPSSGPAGPVAPTPPAPVDPGVMAATADALRSGEPAALLLGGSTCMADPLIDAGRIATAKGAKMLTEVFPTRTERGAGRVAGERLGYLAEFAQMQLDGLSHLILVEAASPVSFFAYPDKASDLVPEGCTVHTLTVPGDDSVGALAELADLVAGDAKPTLVEAFRPDRPTGELNTETVAAALGALLPEGAIVADEGNTTGLFVAGMTAGAPQHDWLCLTGGAIGYGMPVATGAAIAAPGRKVINLESDGSAMYTSQALWTQVRHGLDVTTVILNNSSYAVLNMELNRVGASADGEKAREMLDLKGPDLGFIDLAHAMGVEHATRATTAEEFTAQLEAALQIEGPSLVEAVVPPLL